MNVLGLLLDAKLDCELGKMLAQELEPLLESL